MNKSRIFWGAALLAAWANVGNAGWLDGRPYVGGGVSYTVYDDVDNLASDRDEVTQRHITKNTFGFAGTAGWSFTGNYSLEIGYTDFGEFEIDEMTAYDQNDTYAVNDSGSVTGKSFGVRYDWAESQLANAYGRFGVMRWEAEWDTTATRDAPGADACGVDGNGATIWRDRCVTSGSGNTDGTDFYAGVGGQYEVMPNLYTYVEAYMLDANFDKDGFSENQRIFALYGGVRFRFGDVARPSGATDSRTREVTACDPKYKDVSGVMCE